MVILRVLLYAFVWPHIRICVSIQGEPVSPSGIDLLLEVKWNLTGSLPELPLRPVLEQFVDIFLSKMIVLLESYHLQQIFCLNIIILSPLQLRSGDSSPSLADG